MTILTERALQCDECGFIDRSIGAIVKNYVGCPDCVKKLPT